MTHDGKIDLAVGLSAKSKIWKNKSISWSVLVNKLREENKTNETHKEFMAATKEEQTKIKDVGGFVGGYLRAGRRKPENVVHRQLATLDIDFAHLDFWDDFCLQFENAAVLHGTHKHHDSSPRFRLVMPLSRETTPDEYVAVSRYIAGELGIELFDNTTFETNRLMFWPSTPRDMEYYFRFQDGNWIDVDEVLSTYADWKDSSLWPTADKKFQEVKDHVKKQEDPESKKGIIGAFCRAYPIEECIESFLSEIYIQTDMEDRFTYCKGTAAAGLIVYDNKFAYSHHGTDPCSGKLCNSFDLVRIHLFGHLDSDELNSSTKAKSTKAMEEFALSDKNVKKIIALDNLSTSKYEFSEDLCDSEEIENTEDDNIEWMQELESDSKGTYLSTATNINIIFSNDTRLHKLFRQNDFDNKRYVFGNLPWRKVPKPEPVKNVDYSGVRNYIESIYGISASFKIEDSISLEFEKNHFHPIIDYIKRLVWDGEKRIDTLLIDYLGAEDNIYARESIRKMLVAAVARVFNPGVKFDLVLTLIGDQGTGKSTFIKKLGKDWFSDTFLTVQGKESFEQLQGAWLIEMAELSGLKKAEVESVKHFISKQEDMFRPAYARTPETFKRQCVFFGTTNNKDFLRDPSGNRRFMPIDVNPLKTKKDVFKELESEVDQIWAEAYQLYKGKEKLFLSEEAEAIAHIEQRKHSESDERVGIIEAYLDKKITKNWGEMDIYERRTHLSDPLSSNGTVIRDYVCVAELWCECLCKEKEDMDRYKTRELNDILRALEGWEQCNSTRNFKIYGKQKYYQRKLY